MSADKKVSEKIQEVWDTGHTKKPRSQMIQEALARMTEGEKEQALKDWVGGKLWNLHKEKKERIRDNRRAWEESS